jgi:hypothetical protein
MVAIDHTQVHAVSVRDLAPDFARRRTSHPGHAELHRLRLALDLQIDSMLLTLGAAARDPDSHVPWQRWLAEDLELAQELTASLVISQMETSPSLGAATSGLVRDPLDNLVARYTSMEEVLRGLLARPNTGQEWRTTARNAQIRCRTRIQELHVHRAAAAERAAAVRSAGEETLDLHRRESFLPGELLG